jgi:hypothetical protein
VWPPSQEDSRFAASTTEITIAQLQA